MSDLERGELGGPSNTAFREAYAEAERKAAAEQLGETVAEDAPVETPEAAGAPADGAPADPAEGEQSAAETLLAGKYKTVEELERGMEELQAFAARQGNEVGESRALLQAYEQRLAELEARTAQPQERITHDHIEQDPAAATRRAYAQNDGDAVGQAWQAWSLEDPGAAAAWYAETRGLERDQALRAEFAAERERLEARIAPLAEASQNDELVRSVQALPAETRAFLSDADTVQALANEFPNTGLLIATGNPQQRIEAINTLYNIHRGRVADTLTKTTQDVARSTAEEAQQIRDDSYVASTTTSEETPKTWEQQEQERATAAFQRKSAPNWDGALVKPGR